MYRSNTLLHAWLPSSFLNGTTSRLQPTTTKSEIENDLFCWEAFLFGPQEKIQPIFQIIKTSQEYVPNTYCESPNRKRLVIQPRHINGLLLVSVDMQQEIDPCFPVVYNEDMILFRMGSFVVFPSAPSVTSYNHATLTVSFWCQSTCTGI